ncbi:unnamed protein product [Ectocarpus sp. CCAP 1310/34]|nr:unnamed protein product [Ectocarpus sp. CCAP 1310/34]
MEEEERFANTALPRRFYLFVEPPHTQSVYTRARSVSADDSAGDLTSVRLLHSEIQ